MKGCSILTKEYADMQKWIKGSNCVAGLSVDQWETVKKSEPHLHAGDSQEHPGTMRYNAKWCRLKRISSLKATA